MERSVAEFVSIIKIILNTNNQCKTGLIQNIINEVRKLIQNL
jgi:hypothetical protein